MSSAVETFQLLDPRLAVADNVRYGVEVGPQSQNQQTFRSQTVSTSQVTANCLIPSLQTVIDRNVRIRTQFTLAITGTTNVAGALINYPTNCVLSPFPFSQCVQTLTCQINNTSVNSNYETNLALMLRQMDQADLAKYSDFAPCSLDYYGVNPPVVISAAPATLIPDRTLSAFNAAELTGLGYDVKSRGSFKIDSVAGDSVAGTGARTVYIQVTTTEPLFISPFLFGDGLCEKASGLSGVSSINLNFNLGQALSGRAITYRPYLTGDALTAVALHSVDSFEVLMTFLSPKPSQLIPLTNCLPYYEMPSYKTISPQTAAVGASFTINSSIVSPNSIPDSVYMFVRYTGETALIRASQNEVYFPIKSVAVTWNTQSGLLASATQQTLYEMSKRRGLKMDWPQFSGSAQAVGAVPVNANVANNNASIQTTGGIVCLAFNQDIPIQEQYYSSGSLGLWSFSAQVTCINNTAAQLVGTAPLELVVVFFQSGIFQSTSGSSSQYIGVLSKDECLRVSQEPYVTHNQHYRIVGGDHFLDSMMKGSEGKMKSLVKDVLGEGRGVSGGQDAMEASGRGRGRGISGGMDDLAVEGGRRRGPRTY